MIMYSLQFICTLNEVLSSEQKMFILSCVMLQNGQTYIENLFEKLQNTKKIQKIQKHTLKSLTIFQHYA